MTNEMYSIDGDDDVMSTAPSAESASGPVATPAEQPQAQPVQATRQRIRRGPAEPKILGAGLAKDVDPDTGVVADQVPFVAYELDGVLCVELGHGPKKTVQTDSGKEMSPIHLDLEEAGFKWEIRRKRWECRDANTIDALPESFTVTMKPTE